MSTTSAHILHLPAELRTTIFQTILDDIFLQTKQRPDDAAPPHSRFGAYISLILTCRQIHAEVEALFRKEYAHRTVFYFEEAYKLYEFFRHMGDFPNKSEAWFSLSRSKERVRSRLGVELVR